MARRTEFAAFVAFLRMPMFSLTTAFTNTASALMMIMSERQVRRNVDQHN
ncbi:MAG: hypothetical protein IPG71_12075 [bacterium]|nr:hypothetical protein [bacterium]